MKENDKAKLIWNKRTRYLAAVLVVAGVGIITQVLMGYFMKNQVRITDVFVQSNTSDMTSTLEVAGEYGTETLSQEEKEAYIEEVANAIGLTIGDDLVISQHGTITEICVERKARSADTSIKFVSVDTTKGGEVVGTNQYLLVEMNLYDNIQSILSYKELVEKVYERIGISKPQVTVALTGIYQGQLSLNEKNQVADKMISQLGGNIAYENRTDDMYTVYAYSGNLSDYIKVADSKVNIQVAMNYDERINETVVYLASPILNGSY